MVRCESTHERANKVPYVPISDPGRTSSSSSSAILLMFAELSEYLWVRRELKLGIDLESDGNHDDLEERFNDEMSLDEPAFPCSFCRSSPQGSFSCVRRAFRFLGGAGSSHGA